MKKQNKIKFRFWHTKLKKWLKNCAVANDGKVWDLTTNEEVKDVIPLQFTGSKDKNGKEIYEGDVVYCNSCEEDDNGGVFRVVWGYFEDCCVEGETWVLDGLTWEQTVYYHSLEKDIEVVGNIYENPELLTKLRKNEKN
jgi:uncharacterized phage protein (TIGR01671 family)